MAAPKGKHVLFLTYHLPMDDEPGAFRPWMEARLMARAGWEVTVITNGIHYMTGQDVRRGRGWCVEERCDNIRIMRLWGVADHRRSLVRRVLNYGSFALLSAVASISKVGKVDRLFVGTDPLFIMPVAWLVSRVKKAGMILDERDLFPETAVALGVLKEDSWLTQFFSAMQKWFRRQAHAILAATPGIRKRLLEEGLNRDKVFLLLNADVFLPKQSLPQKMPYDLRKKTRKRFIVGYAGGLGMANDIPTLLRAAKRLHDVSDLAVVIVGGGERREEYEHCCREHALENVHFLDALPRQQARALMKQFDVGIQVLPNGEHFESTLTSKTFDYLSLGIPVIFAGIGDTEKLLAQSGAGMTVPPGDDAALADAIRLLYQNGEQRAHMAQAASHWFRKNLGMQQAIMTMHSLLEA